MSKKFNYRNATELERATAEMINNIGYFADQNVSNIINAMTNGESSVLKNGHITPGTDLAISLDADSLISIKKTLSDVVYARTEEEQELVLSTADSTNSRIDVIVAKIDLVETAERDIQIINSTTKDITSTSKNTKRQYQLALESIEGTPSSSPSAPSISNYTAATFTSDGSTLNTEERDLSSAQDLTSLYNIKIRIDSDSYVTVDLRGSDSGSTSLSEIVANINSACDTAYGTSGEIYASVFDSSYLRIHSLLSDDTGKVEISNPASNDATNLILGLIEESSGYFYSFKNEMTYVKLAEVTVPAGATSISTGNIKDSYVSSQWDIVEFEPVITLNQFPNGLYTDTISELTSGNGIFADGVVLKDNDVYADEIRNKAGTGPFSAPSGMNGNVTGDVTGDVTGNVTGDVTGNSGTVTNGVYTTGNQTIGGIKTFSSPVRSDSFLNEAGSELPDYSSVPSSSEYYTGKKINGQKVYAIRITGTISTTLAATHYFFVYGGNFTTSFTLNTSYYPINLIGTIYISSTLKFSPGSFNSTFGSVDWFIYNDGSLRFFLGSGDSARFSSAPYYLLLEYTKTSF